MIIVISVALCLSLCSGIKWLEVTTDPIELWAAPSSAARVQKDFYDATFRPFYRTQQVIVRSKNLSSFTHEDVFNINRTFGPIFNKEKFMLPLLSLQKAIEDLRSYPNGVMLKEVCNQPLHGGLACNIQNLWAYWQDDTSNLDITQYNADLGRDLGYLDHFLACAKNPTLDKNSDQTQKLPCMSKGGIPVQAFYILGGFMPEGQTVLPEGARYEEADTVMMSILLDNYDTKSKSDEDIEKLQRAMEWEETYINFLKNVTSNGTFVNGTSIWATNPDWVTHMDIAFMSERSPQDELDRETYGDIVTIVLSYLFMFLYITVSLGSFTKWSRVMVSE